MKHASLFSGIGGAELAASWMGWDNLFHCEINTFGRKVLEYWFPKSKSYEDITKTDFREWRGKIDVLTGGFPCFKSGTHVMTSEGFKNIENISIGDLILTKEGRYMPCNAIMNKIAKEIVGIRAQGLYESIITTQNHPFFIKRKNLNEEIWINAGEVKKGDMIAYRCIDGKLKVKDENYWYMVGRFLGDGWILDGKRKSKIEKGHRGSRVNSINHKVVICCNKKESECLKSIILNAGYKYTFSPDRTTDKFIICSQELVCELMDFGRYSYGKKLSKESFQLEKYRKKALFEGWLSADGYIDKNGSYKITTVSEELAIGMASIARDVYKFPVSISKKTVNRICKIEGRVVNERPQYCVTVSNCNKYGYYKDGFVWCLVKNVYREFKEVKVYNIGVLEDETYTANGITVHNCQPFSQAGKRKGDTDDRYLWPQMLRAIREIRPTWVVGENVAGIVTMVESCEEVEMGRADDIFEENIIYRKEQEFTIERICKDFEREGYSVQPIVIPACAVGAPHRRDRVWFIAHANGDGYISSRPCERIKEQNNEVPQQNKRGFSSERINGLSGLQQSIAHTRLQRQKKPKEQTVGAIKFYECKTITDTECSRGRKIHNENEQKQSDGHGINCNGDERTVANTYGDRWRIGENEQKLIKGGKRKTNNSTNGKVIIKTDWSNFPTQSPICSRNDGISDRLDGITFPKWRAESIKAYGNAWVPQVAYEIFKAIESITQ